MATYDFRLRFHLPETFRINADTEELELLITPAGQRLRLKTGAIGTPIKDHTRLAIVGGEYATDTEARSAAESCKRTLLYWATKQRHGIDFGDGRQRSVVTDAGLKMLEKEHGGPVRNDLHGVDVFEHVAGLKFVHTRASLQALKGPKSLLQTFSAEFAGTRVLTEKQVLACELYASSWFDVGQRSRFITLVTAVEALLEPATHVDDVQTLIDGFLAALDASGTDERLKASLRGSVERLRTQSIGQAGRDLSATLLAGRDFKGEASGDFFGRHYGIRSEILHSGTTEADVWRLANDMEEFVAQLLAASLDQAQPGAPADAAAPRG